MGQTERRKVAVKKSLLLVQAETDNKERESMSEKEKMESEEIAKVLAENPTAKIYLAGLAQGMKLAKSMEPEAEQPTPADKEAANE